MLKKVLFFDVFPAVCWFMALMFMLLALLVIGFPPSREVGSAAVFFVLVSSFFILVPVAKKVSLGKFLSFEREIERVRTDVSDFKSDVRASLTVTNSLVNAVSNAVNQTVNVHMPSLKDAREAEEALDSALGETDPTHDKSEELSKFLQDAGGDINFALAKLRMDIERKLRQILGKRTETSDPSAARIKFLSANSLFREFVKQFPQYKSMEISFDYILRVCNAAIHGQNVSFGHGIEALDMGHRMLRELENVSPRMRPD